MPGIVHADLKRLAFSPFFGPLPAANYKYVYDLELGDDEVGLRHVADYSMIAPIAGSIPIPFLADMVPFFERFCLDLRIAGFGLKFDLARPFPKPSPLLIFELLGFLSDTSVPIDPNGHIAGLMYAELYHGRISVPERVQALFPAANGIVGQDLQAKIDVTTIIALYQQLQGLWDALQQRLANGSASTADWLQELADQPPAVGVAELLRLLPEHLRTLQLEGRFLHFEASATFMLALASDIDAAFGDAGQGPPPPPGDAYEPVFANDFSTASLAGWQRYNHGLKRGTGNWRVVQGQLLQDNNVGDNSPGRYGAMLVYEALEIDDLRLLVTASSTDNDGLGVVFHVQNARTFYRFRMTEEQKEWRLDKLDDGRVTTLFSSERSFVRDRRYDIRIETVSRAGDSAGLPARSAGSGTGRPGELLDVSALVDAKGQKPLSITRVRIWVDGVAWCDVDDADEALTFGHIGLDSWWNSGARFDDLQLFARWQPVLGIGHALSADALPALASTLSGPVGEAPAALVAFSSQDIAAALADAPALAVAMTARVRLAGSQIFSMIGWMTSDGRYGLLSQLNLSPLQLDVAGIPIAMPLQIDGRLALTGHSAGADSHVRVEASVFADWTLLPGAAGGLPLARLLIGTAEQPVSLRMSSDREFALQGGGELQLFAQQLVIEGELDVSHAHALISGELTFEPDVFIAGQRLLSLQAAMQGRVSPGQGVALQGEGMLSLFGRAFTAGSVRIAEHVIELSAEVGTGTRIGSWSPAGLPLKQVRLALAGSLDFSAPAPALRLRGDGGFTLHGAQVEGNCRIESQGSDWLLAASGRLFWQGRNWIDGSLTLSNDGFEISGRADFGIRLTPTQLPAGIEIAGLHLRASVSGRFTLNKAGQLTSWSFDLDWQLAVRLPGTDDTQALPIATQHLPVSGSLAGTDVVMPLADLVAFNGLTLFDLDQFSVLVPTLDPDSGQAIYLRNALHVDVDGDGGDVTFLTPVPPDDDATPVFEVPGLIGFYEDSVAIDLPGLSLPVPVLSTEAADSSDTPLLRVPGPGFEQVSLGRIRFDNTAFALQLAWQDGKLGVLIAGEDRFVPFDGNLFLGIIVVLGDVTGS